MPKPNDFFVGVIDLFSIFVPGSIFVFALYQLWGNSIPNIFPTTGTNAIIAFIIASYFLGHLVFLIASRIDYIYHYHLKAKKNDPFHQVKEMAVAIQRRYLSDQDIGYISTDKWCTAYLTTHHEAAMVDINTLVADSKFFRSLCIVMPALSYIVYELGTQVQSLLTLLLIIPCYIRYFERRLKSKMRIFQYMIMLSTMSKLPQPKQ